MTKLKWTDLNPDELPIGRPAELECQCHDLGELDLMVVEGDAVLEHPGCGKPVNLDALGWWDEALHMDDPVRVKVEFVIDHDYMNGPEPSHILLTPRVTP